MDVTLCKCGVKKNKYFPFCLECKKKQKLCKEQFCSAFTNKPLCKKHWKKSEQGDIDECPQCGLYKNAQYLFCRGCGEKANEEDKQSVRRYDQVPFQDVSVDPKASDKRRLYHHQQERCVYCGNVYQYDELQIEHMIPKVRGGSDHIRNCQLACRRCNQAKGTLTDIQFREKYASYLPQQERTPAQPPIDPEKLQTVAPSGDPIEVDHHAEQWRKIRRSETPSRPRDPVERRVKPGRTSISRTEELRRKLGLVDKYGNSVSASSQSEDPPGYRVKLERSEEKDSERKDSDPALSQPEKTPPQRPIGSERPRPSMPPKPSSEDSARPQGLVKRKDNASASPEKILLYGVICLVLITIVVLNLDTTEAPQVALPPPDSGLISESPVTLPLSELDTADEPPATSSPSESDSTKASQASLPLSESDSVKASQAVLPPSVPESAEKQQADSRSPQQTKSQLNIQDESL